MENQHRKIKGYRELSEAEIALMNEIKSMGEQLKALYAKVEMHLDEQFSKEADDDELERLGEADPYQWAFDSRGEMQTAIMKLVRAVAQPTTF